MPHSKKPLLVRVTWLDPTTHTGWVSPEEAAQLGANLMESTGYFVSEDETYLRLALDRDLTDGPFNGIGALVRGGIQKVEFGHFVPQRKKVLAKGVPPNKMEE